MMPGDRLRPPNPRTDPIQPEDRMKAKIMAAWGLAAILLTAAPVEAAAAGNGIDIQSVTSQGGITAWLVEDDTIPLIAMNFSFAGGAAVDPDDKAGLANFLSTMLDEGAGE